MRRVLSAAVVVTALAALGDVGAPAASVTMNGSLSYNDKPILAISPSGQDVYLAFNDKTDAYAVASHDYGATFSAPVKTNADDFEYLAYGGTVAPNGNVYFGETGEAK